MMLLAVGALCFAGGMIVGVIFHAVLKTDFHKAGAALPPQVLQVIHSTAAAPAATPPAV